MSLSRAELESLDRDTLIREAERVGVNRARIMTRPELVDEILLARAENRAEVKKARGFFGMARDLLFKAVERGLNLPDAHERFSAPPSEPHGRPRVGGEVIPTVTLAEIYAAQGHTDKAIETVRGVLAREPDHAAAHALLAKLEDEEYDAPPPPDLGPEDGGMGNEDGVGVEDGEEVGEEVGDEDGVGVGGMRDAVAVGGMRDAVAVGDGVGVAERGAAMKIPLPSLVAEDSCFALPDGDVLRVEWDVRLRTLAYHRALLPQGRLALRVAVIAPNVEKPRRSFRDIEVEGERGSYVVSGLPIGVVVRVAIGIIATGAFFPLAHAPAVERDGGEIYVWTPTGKAPLPPRMEAMVG